MTSLQHLLERMKAADGADRELDVAIFYGIDPQSKSRFDEVKIAIPEIDWERWERFRDSHPYTASIDAALALVERLLPGWTVRMTWQPKLNPPEGFCELGGSAVQSAPTPALAILAALLSTLISQSNPEGGKEERL